MQMDIFVQNEIKKILEKNFPRQLYFFDILDPDHLKVLHRHKRGKPRTIQQQRAADPARLGNSTIVEWKDPFDAYLSES